MGSDLPREIAEDILRMAREERWPVGAAVGEQTLAKRLGVSRTPVRQALLHLAEKGILTRRPHIGFKLARMIEAGDMAKALGRRGSGGYRLYERIMFDRARGHITEEVCESELLSRYGASHRELTRAMAVLATEGIVQRQRGHGWRFRESLENDEALADSYAFRLAVEAAALRQPGFSADMGELERLRDDHDVLLAPADGVVQVEDWLRVNDRFHETLAQWSHNRFFLQAVQRQNALRRMHQFADFPDLTPDDIAQSCREHLAILDAIAAGDPARAARLLEDHLRFAAEDWQPRP